jgi:hypothetical protein
VDGELGMVVAGIDQDAGIASVNLFGSAQRGRELLRRNKVLNMPPNKINHLAKAGATLYSDNDLNKQHNKFILVQGK